MTKNDLVLLLDNMMVWSQSMSDKYALEDRELMKYWCGAFHAYRTVKDLVEGMDETL